MSYYLWYLTEKDPLAGAVVIGMMLTLVAGAFLLRAIWR